MQIIREAQPQSPGSGLLISALKEEPSHRQVMTKDSCLGFLGSV